MLKNLIKLTIAAMTIGSLGMVLLYTGILRFNYPNKKKFPIRGIDISHHQKEIDWNKLKNENLDFAFIKATEGGDFKDPLFKENWDNAKKINLVVGAYHFFTFCRPAIEQAANFMESVPKQKNSLPPVIDLEFGGNCQARPTKEKLLQELGIFITEIHQAYDQKPILYLTYETYEQYLQGQLSDIKIWIRDIYKHPKLKNERTWAFWQYSNRGRLQGIDTYVDLNVFNGNKTEFEKLIEYSNKLSPQPNTKP